MAWTPPEAKIAAVDLNRNGSGAGTDADLQFSRPPFAVHQFTPVSTLGLIYDFHLPIVQVRVFDC